MLSSKYEVDNGQRTSFYDYSRIVRLGNQPAPTRRLKIVYRYYVVPSADEGDIFSINSYDAARYDDDITYLGIDNAERLTDFIDIPVSYTHLTLPTILRV